LEILCCGRCFNSVVFSLTLFLALQIGAATALGALLAFALRFKRKNIVAFSFDVPSRNMAVPILSILVCLRGSRQEEALSIPVLYSLAMLITGLPGDIFSWRSIEFEQTAVFLFRTLTCGWKSDSIQPEVSFLL
jgi:hypothetical protein